MPAAMIKAKTMPVVPPMALPMMTISTVSRDKSRVVLQRFIAYLRRFIELQWEAVCRRGVIKKTFTPGIVAWIKVLLTV
jgi:hypothetical protein